MSFSMRSPCVKETILQKKQGQVDDFSVPHQERVRDGYRHEIRHSGQLRTFDGNLAVIPAGNQAGEDSIDGSRTGNHPDFDRWNG